MSKIAYIPMKRFKPESLAKIKFANAILEDLTSRGFTPTLRQVYYRFVAAVKIDNTQREYKNLGSLLNDARLCGLVDWDHMVDRTRNIQSVGHWRDPADIINACAESFAIDKWRGQPWYVEVWVEKDAQVDVISQACEPLDVSYFSCRGYVSQSEMWGAAQRLMRRSHDGRKLLLVHLGDHDPSGIDMTRDIGSRLEVFGIDLKVERIALNMNQIEDQRPPPNPAKITDSRARAYIENYGKDSWELDALDPDFTVNLITEVVKRYRDEGLWDELVREENEHRYDLGQVRDNWDDIIENL